MSTRDRSRQVNFLVDDDELFDFLQSQPNKTQALNDGLRLLRAKLEGAPTIEQRLATVEEKVARLEAAER